MGVEEEKEREGGDGEVNSVKRVVPCVYRWCFYYQITEILTHYF